MKRNKKIIFVFIIFVTLITLSNVNLAIENEIVLETTDFTEEYKKWVKIPQEERDNYILPKIYEDCDDITSNNNVKKLLNNNISSLNASEVPSTLTTYTVPYYGGAKDQGSTGACWAFSAASVFNSNYYISNNKSKKLFSNYFIDFITSTNYNPYSKGFCRQFNEGGNMNIAAAYATNGMGIALQSEMNTSTLENATYVYNNLIKSSNVSADTVKSELSNVKASSYVKRYVNITGKDQIKEFVYNYGAISGYTYASSLAYFSVSTVNDLYYNDIAYCCSSSSLSADHAITIIGWDDNYTNSAFSGKQGAYTVLNSWGSSFGQNGIYHIFYDDVFMQSSLIGVIETKDIDYDNLYQYDESGYVSAIGSSSYSTIYGANVFSKSTSNNEQLKQIGFYAPATGNYSIYLNKNGSNCSVSNAELIVSNYNVTKTGYYTISLSSPITLENSQFTLIIKYPVGFFAAEYPYSSGYWFSNSTSPSGVSFMSWDGESYTNLYSGISSSGFSKVNVCLKAFTDNMYTVTFNSNGGSEVDSQSVTKGGNATKPTNPTKSGYTFEYWYLNDENQEFDFSNTTITENITLNAKWNEKGTYTVTFYSNEGAESWVQEIDKGEKITNFPTTTKQGSVFKGWFTESELENEFDPETVITKDTTLYAKFIELNDFFEESELPFEIETTYIRKIKSKTSVLFDLDESVSVKVLSSSNEEKTSGIIGTGDTIKLYQSDNEIGSYKAIITGDPTGDGSINIADIILSRRHIIGNTTLQDEYEISADVTDDDSVNVNDIMKLRQHIIGTESIE